METGDEASVAKTINARSGQVYNCDDKLAKELDMSLLRSAYFLLTIKVPSPDFEISAKEYVFFWHYHFVSELNFNLANLTNSSKEEKE